MAKDNKKTCTDHEGREFPSERAMCAYWHVNQATFHNRMKRGWTLEESLTGQHIVDHKGNKFHAENAMCNYWHVSRRTFRRRIECGWSLKESLTYISPNTKISDHLMVMKPVQVPFYAICFDGKEMIWHEDMIFNYYRKVNNITILPQSSVAVPCVATAVA